MFRVCVALSVAAAAAHAASVGYKIGTCDPLEPSFGCPAGMYGTGPDNQPNNRLNCTVPARIMPWAVEPSLSSAFVVSAGDDEANPVTAYTPGELMTIRIRTNDRDVRFRGVLISAEQSGTRTRVGAWEHAPAIPPLFDHPRLVGCENTLIHASANVKHSNLVAKWRAPPAGTGSVRFEMLLKHGGANHGWFFRPAQTLVLTEGAPATPPAVSAVRWVRSNLGETCAGACTRQPEVNGSPLACAETAFAQATEAEMTPVFNKELCTLPYISGCGSLGPRTGAGALCYYHDVAVCAATGRATAVAACDASSTDPAVGERFCPCTVQPTQCVPLTACPDPSTQCGTIPDGCGGFVGCGGCPGAHDVCTNNACVCAPHTCSEHGFGCGTHDNGCGEPINCGTCAGNVSFPVCYDQSVCVPANCTPADVCPTVGTLGGNGQGCGLLRTTCLETGNNLEIDCGTCRAPSVCDPQSNMCNCVPRDPSVACAGGCGYADDGCGGTVTCSPCECEPGASFRAGACVCDEGFEIDRDTGLCAEVASDGASSRAPSVTAAVLAVAALATAFRGPGSLMALLALMAVLAMVMGGVAPAAAHNWINSPSRSDNANTIKPHKPGQLMPHVQVAAGQKFQIEWQTAHTSSDLSYFITVAYGNQHLLNEITQAGLHDYLDSCPSSACPGGPNAVAQQVAWQRYHRKGAGGDNLHNDHGVTGDISGWRNNFFAELITPAHPDYVPRPAVFGGWIRDTGTVDEPTGIQKNPGYPDDPANIHQLRYKAADLGQDKRATYSNPAYPGIISVAAFYHSAGQFIRPDFAQFEIPVGSAPGRYLVNWWWQGYYDSIDVDVVPSAVAEADKYGSTGGPDVWFQIDHAQFENPSDVKWTGCAQVVNSVNHCLVACEGDQWCDGVNVVPIHYPPLANPAYETTEDLNRVPWDFDSGLRCPKAELQKAPSGSYMCFPVAGRNDFGVANTLDIITITDDPDDPVFYSRAYQKFDGLKFDLSNSVLPVAAGSWNNGDKCLTCEDTMARASEYYSFPLLTADAVTCINCDREPFTGPIPTAPPPAGWSFIGPDRECDGAPDNSDVDGPPLWSSPTTHHTCSAGTRCVKNLGPFSARVYRDDSLPNVEDFECAELARRDPECSDIVMSWFTASDNTTTDWTRPLCSCYLRTPCCLTCSARALNSNGQSNWGQGIYQLNPPPADPTCANGVRNSAGTVCCPSTCDVADCGVSVYTGASSVGLCAGVPERSCALFGPPCLL